MTSGRTPGLLRGLGALLVLYLGYPLAAFVYRVVVERGNEGWSVPGLWPALEVSVQSSTISLLIGVLGGIPLAYFLARRHGWLSSTVLVLVQLPLAVPPLVSGILLIYIVGPYTFLGQLSGEQLTQTMYGLIIAQTFVSVPFLVVVARSAFRAVDPSLDDVAATLGHGPLARFLRVDVPAAADGLRAGMILMWLRAFGEYGTTVVLAYHPYSIPIYVDNLFSSAPLNQAEAPTILAFGVAVVAVSLGHVRRPGRIRRRRTPVPVAPVLTSPTPVGFDIDATVGTFRLRVAHREGGHRLAIIGPSGSGKSVTLRVLAGLLGPGAGAVTYDGTDVSRTAPERRRVGYVPQGFSLIPGRTVWQQAVFGVHADPARAAWWLETLHIGDLLDRLPEQLSGGQRQRVSLARALAVDPQIVLLDEPFSALDAPVRAELRRELRRLQRDVNLSTVLVTHDPEEAAMLADEIVVVSDGRVLQTGSCHDVYQRPASVAVGRLLGIDNLFEGAAGADGLLLVGTSHAPDAAPDVLRDGIPVGLATGLPAGTRLLWQVPPEALRVSPARPLAAGALPAVSPASVSPGVGTPAVDLGQGLVTDIVDLGRTVEVVVDLSSGVQFRARTLQMPDLSVGSACRVAADTEAVTVWPEQALPTAVSLPGAGS